jgi:hypothetical protein
MRGCLTSLLRFRASPKLAADVREAAAAADQSESEFCREAIREHVKKQARMALYGAQCHFGRPGYAGALAAAEPQCREAARVGGYEERCDLAGVLSSLAITSARVSPDLSRGHFDEAISLFDALAADPAAHDGGKWARGWAETMREERERLLGAVAA